MDLSVYFRAVLEEDRCPVVLCSLAHEIIYMNPAARQRYGGHGGGALVGQSIFSCHGERSRELIRQVAAWFAESPSHNRVYTFRNEQENKDVYMVALRDGAGKLIGYYEKHEYRTPETAPLYAFGG